MKRKMTKGVLGVAAFVVALVSAPLSASAGVENGWEVVGDQWYWYENGIRQGYDANDASYRGKEIYDPDSNAWYWLDNVQQGAKAVSKDVYQESKADDEGNIGKWVRYDENGHMIKGWDINGNGTYYFDLTYGSMLKGTQTIDGVEYYFNEATGVLESCSIGFGSQWVNIGGVDYWYEGGIRQGYDPMDGSYRGKEIYDPGSDAWYWLDNVQQGAKAVSKDVYQESFAGEYADCEDGTGKWVRYDAEGHMIKGWNEQNGNTYYFDPVTGAMVKKTIRMNGLTYSFNSMTGILENSQSAKELCNLPEYDQYYKYEYAYKSGDISGLAESDMAFYYGLKEYLDYAYQFNTPYEQEKAIHDYMVLNCEYDYGNYSNGTIPWDSYYPPGVFVNKKAVCNGYATSFKLCMDILGIECVMVVGTPEMNHAWNAVKLDNEWYMIDVTWDDPVPDEQGRLRYAYFNIPDAIMKINHDYVNDISANSKKYSGDIVMELSSDTEMNEVIKLLEQRYLTSDRYTVFALYVTKADGGNWTQQDYSQYYWMLKDLPYADGYEVEYNPQQGSNTLVFHIIGTDTKKKTFEITTDTRLSELRGQLTKEVDSMGMDDVLSVKLKLNDGSSIDKEGSMWSNEAASKYADVLNTYFSTSYNVIDEKTILFSCKKNVENLEQYSIKGEVVPVDVDMDSLLSCLQKCDLDSRIVLLFEDVQWNSGMIQFFKENAIPGHAVSLQKCYSYEDGAMALILKKTGELSTADCQKTASCNLYPFHPYYKYEYAYRYQNTSGLSGDELAFYNGLKGYLDYAYQFDTSYEQEKAIHDYMILHCTNEGTYGDEGSTPYGVFVNQCAGQMGYQKAFQLCMDILGIDCLTESGNLVRLDGTWYLVYTIWDDNNFGYSWSREQIQYRYFNVPMSEIGWTSQSCVDANRFYGNAFINIDSLEDTDEIAEMLKNEYNIGNADASFFRVKVTKSDGTKWSDEESNDYLQNLRRANYAPGYKLQYKVMNDTELWITCDGYELGTLEYHITSEQTREEVQSALTQMYEASKETDGITLYLTKADGTDWQSRTEAYNMGFQLFGNNYNYDIYEVFLDGNTAVYSLIPVD